MAEVADTAQARRVGLMGRKSLPQHYGLIMVFERPSAPGIWMKHMHFPLDIVWISDSGEIIDLQTLQPCTLARCPIFRPKGSATYVLEVGAGKFPLKIGEVVEILHPSGDSLFPPDLQ